MVEAEDNGKGGASIVGQQGAARHEGRKQARRKRHAGFSGRLVLGLLIVLAPQAVGATETPATSITNVATGTPVITGVAQVGKTLTAGKGTISDGDGTTKADAGTSGYAYTYQWVRIDGTTDTTIAGATHDAYTLTADDQGKRVKVEVSFKDDADNDEGPLASDPYRKDSTIRAAKSDCLADNNWCATLTVERSSTRYGHFNQESGRSDLSPDSFTYGSKTYEVALLYRLHESDAQYFIMLTDRHLPDGSTATLDQATFTLPAARGHSLGEYYADLGELGVSLDTWIHGQEVTVGIGLGNVPAEGKPVITGTVDLGEVLTASPGTITDDDGTTKAADDDGDHGYTYQWIHLDDDGSSNAMDIPGETSDTYTVGEADRDKTLKVRASFKDDLGYDESRTSDATASLGGAAKISGLSFTNRPSDNVYRLGDVVEVSVTFDKAVTVTPATVTQVPRLRTNFDGNDPREHYTEYHSAAGTGTTVVFRRDVTGLLDDDTNGISVFRNAFDLMGGTIRSHLTVDAFLEHAPLGGGPKIRTRSIQDIEHTSTPRLAETGFYGPGEKLEFTVVFDEAITVDPSDGVPELEVVAVDSDFLDGFEFERKRFPYQSGSGSERLVYAWTIPTQLDERADELPVWIEENLNEAIKTTIPFSLRRKGLAFSDGTLFNADGIRVNSRHRYFVFPDARIDVTGPSLETVTVDRGVMTLVYGNPRQESPEVLDETSKPAPGDFEVTAAGAASVVTEVSLDGANVVLTLGSAVRPREQVRVNYVPGTNPIQDRYRNPAEALTNQSVRNLTPDPELSITDASAPEDAGTLDFDVSMSTASGATVTVDYASADDTATAGADYTAVARTLSIAPGEVTGTISVNLVDDRVAEDDETFTVTLSNATRATIATTTALGTITDTGEDPARVSNAAFTGTPADGEYNRGDVIEVSVTFDKAVVVTGQPRVSLDLDATPLAEAYTTYSAAASSDTVLVFHRTVTGVMDDEPTGIGVPNNGLHLDGGTIRTKGGTRDANLTHGPVAGGFPIRTRVIEDISITSESVVAGSGVYGPGDEVVITVTFEKAVTVDTAGGSPTLEVRVSANADDGLARPDFAYGGGSGTRNLEFSWTVPAQVADDHVGLSVRTNVLGGAIQTDRGLALNDAVIEDEDGPVVIRHGDYPLNARIDTRAPVLRSATVDVATLVLVFEDPATSGPDSLAPSEPAPGDFTVTADGTAHPVVDVSVSGTNVTLELDAAIGHALGVTVGHTPGANPIRDRFGNAAAAFDGQPVQNDSPEPAISIADAAVREDDGAAVFDVVLNGESGEAVTVDYSSADGTATDGTDYTAVAGSLTFQPGDVAATISVTVVDDGIAEDPETFTVTIADASNADISRSTATGTISDTGDANDPPVFNDGAGTSRQLAETIGGATTSTATDVGGPVAATDPDPDDALVYSLEGVDAGRFEIVASTGQIRTRPDERYDYEQEQRYAVTVKVTDGAVSATIAVTILVVNDTGEVPLAPGRPTVTPVSGSTMDLDVSWSAPDNAGRPPIASYDIRYRPTTQTDWRDGPRDLLVTRASLSGLAADTEYLFQVRAANADGDGAWSPAGSGRTADNDPPVFNDGASTSRQLAETVGGATTSSATDVGSPVAATDPDPDDALVYSLEGVDAGRFEMVASTGQIRTRPGERYDYEHQQRHAVTVRVTDGAVSATIAVTIVIVDNTGEVPLAPGMPTVTPVSGNMDLDVRWSAPGNAGRPPIANYDVRYRQTSLADWRNGPRDVLVTRASLSGLDADTEYLVQVRAANADGDGAWSPTGRGRTADAEPTPPDAVWLIPFYASMSRHPGRQGFVRVINRSASDAVVEIEAFDDSGSRSGPATFEIRAGTAAHFNSNDLEDGNASKHLPGGVGAPSVGDWRLELTSGTDIDVLSYMRTTEGFVTAQYATAPVEAGVHRVAILNPASNVNQVSLLRLVNPGGEYARATIAGVDDDGAASGEVVVEIPPWAALMLASADLESGSAGDGALGDGEGKWRLTVTSDDDIVVMSLLQSPGAPLTNLSTVPGETDGDIHRVPLFPSLAGGSIQQGFVRVINHADTDAVVEIAAFDESDRDYDTVSLTVAIDQVAHFNSTDLEMGNADKGLMGSTGTGVGDWWLELTSDADIEVLSYIRTTTGFLTSMHELVPRADDRYRITFFNPARNINQVSRLRMINPGDEATMVTITGIDDDGVSPGSVSTSLAARSVRSITAVELESGGDDLDGALGTGAGKWELIVESPRPIIVMSILESPTGHLTNLSTGP